jgi:hypothetical protein
LLLTLVALDPQSCVAQLVPPVVSAVARRTRRLVTPRCTVRAVVTTLRPFITASLHPTITSPAGESVAAGCPTSARVGTSRKIEFVRSSIPGNHFSS